MVNYKKINVALIGCGRISHKHITSIIKLNDSICLKAICDIKQNNLDEVYDLIENLFSKFNYKNEKVFSFLDYEELLNAIKAGAIDINLIVLCTPSGFHVKQSIAAAKLSLNVITEKPLATSLEDGKKILKAFKNKNTNLFVVLQNRLNPTVKLLKKQILKKRFGKIYLITSNIFWQRPQQYYDQATWRGTKLMDGGALLNQASHYVDLLCYLPNLKVNKVSSFTKTLARKIEMEDTAVINLEYANGALGSLAVTMLSYPKNLEGSLTIFGENGTVRIGGIAMNKIETWEFKDDDNDDDLVESTNYEVDSVYGSGHIYFYEEIISFLNNLNNSTDNLFNANEAFYGLEAIMAAYKSSIEESTVSLPMQIWEI